MKSGDIFISGYWPRECYHRILGLIPGANVQRLKYLQISSETHVENEQTGLKLSRMRRRRE